ncbi:MAG: cysteine desulfurase [Eubacterium sp.]|nr:cysteine desulfurase [Eubacterium sp.]
MIVYLDNSSTTRQADEVTDLIYEISKNDFGNPSSLHSIGFSAEKLVEAARKSFAASIGADPSEITFNSGGTEGDNTVLFGAARARRHDGRRIVISAVEHPAIMEAADRLKHDGFEIVKVGVSRDGIIDMDELRDAVNDDTILVSVMTVNNETGVLMPVRNITEIAHSHGALMHTDAVQAYGKIDMSCFTGSVSDRSSKSKLTDGVDFITVSSHKIHGPKGVGALYQKKGFEVPAYIVGGGQEKNRRSGTENVPGIAGFGKACDLAADLRTASYDKAAEARKYLLDGILDRIPDVLVNSPEVALNSSDAIVGSAAGDTDGITAMGIPYVLNVSFLGTRGEVLLHTLEQDGIFVSIGSACSSNKKGGSYVLAAMGRTPKEIEATIRFSLCRYNTVEEMDYVLDKVEAAVSRFRRLGSFR